MPDPIHITYYWRTPMRYTHSKERLFGHAVVGAPHLEVHEADVVVHVSPVRVAQPLHVLLDRQRVAQVAVHAAAVEAGGGAEAGVVYHDAVHRRVADGLVEADLEVHFVDLPHVEVDAVGLARLGGPLWDCTDGSELVLRILRL